MVLHGSPNLRMQYHLFDIVMLRPEFASRIFAIVELVEDRPENPYAAVRLERGPLTKRYLLNDEQILVRIGTLAPEALSLDKTQLQPAPPPDWEIGQSFAAYMANRAPTELDRRRWSLLAHLKPGDCVPIKRVTRSAVRVEHHRFREVLPSGQKYHFTALNANGTIYRWTLDSLYLEPETK